MIGNKLDKFLLIFLFSITLLYSISYSDDQLKEGETLLKTKQYLKCRDFFKKFIEQPQVADRALLGTGKCEYFLGNYQEANMYLRRLVRDFKESPAINEGYLYLGLSYLKMGRDRDAEFYLNKVEPPLEKFANVGLGWIAYRKGDLKAVEKVLSKLTKNDLVENPDAHLLKIKYLASTGRAEESLKEFDNNPILKTKNYDLDKAEILIRAMKYGDAEKVLKKVIQYDEKIFNKVRAKVMLFQLYLDQGRNEEALNLANDIYPYLSSDDLRVKLIDLYLAQKKYDEVLRVLTTIKDQKLRVKKIDEVIRHLETENPQKVSEFIMKTYTFLPNDSLILIDYSEILIKYGRLSDAKKLLKKLLNSPRKAEGVIPYAKILVQEGNLKEAKKMLDPLKDKKPLATALYAQILYKEGDKKNALTHMRKVIKSVDDPSIILIAGDLEYSEGDKKNALTLWTKSANLGNAEAALKAADYYYIMKNTKEASKYYKKAIEIGNLDSNSMLWAYYQYGKINKDRKYLEKVANSQSELSKAAREILETL